MGYTHYWYRTNKEHSQEKWDKFTTDFREVMDNIPDDVDLADGGGEVPDGWVINKEEICFNGLRERSHETFRVERLPHRSRGDRGNVFSFCKTAHKEYDIMVVACLILYKYHFGAEVQISSDGDWDEWEDGLALVIDSLPDKGKEIAVEAKFTLFDDNLSREDAS